MWTINQLILLHWKIYLQLQTDFFLKAHSGEEALKIALDQKLDLIILDVQMPLMDGFEVAQILKSNTKTKEAEGA